MSLPDMIEIVPLEHPIRARITVPGSKSITNRALILAALGEGETELKGALWSEDTQVMVDALKVLGFQIQVEPDPAEFCNRTIRVKGLAGAIPRGGTAAEPLDIFVGNAGTAARFLAPLVCLGHGVYRLHGVARMHQRPQKELFSALRKLGYEIESSNDRLPALIRGSGPKRAACDVSILESSQFASGLILCSKKGGWHISIAAQPEQPPYVRMTLELMSIFPEKGGAFQIEADASSGSYFLAANQLVPTSISVEHWPNSGWQIDEHFPKVILRNTVLSQGLEKIRNSPQVSNPKQIISGEVCDQTISRAKDLGDSIMTAVMLAPFSLQPIRFIDLGRLRLQESERVAALKNELTKCGAKVCEAGDTLEVSPSPLHGAEIETYDDHRIAMCFAILGLKVPGMRIKNPSCVKKTFPNFFQKLAHSNPTGIGAKIIDAHARRELSPEQLFAD